jgi:hypothetical protein
MRPRRSNPRTHNERIASLPVERRVPRRPVRLAGARARSVPVPWLGGLARGPALLPVPLVLTALLVGAVRTRMAATVKTWIILGRWGP